MKKILLTMILIMGVFLMLKPINSIIKDSIGNILFRGNVVTGIVDTDNGNGSYNVFISESDEAYPNIFTLAENPDIEVDDKVRILYKNGDRNNPIILPPVTVTALTLYESQLVDDGNWMSISGSNKLLAMIFITTSEHDISRVHLYMTKTGNPGIINVTIKATDGNWSPTGSILASGNTDGNTLPTSIGEWREIDLTSYTLSDATRYAIIINAPNASGSNYVHWWGTNEMVYPDGLRKLSLDGGVTWYAGQFDLTFKIYGK